MPDILKPDPTAEKLVNYLACPCEVFPPQKKDAALLAAYRRALEEGRTQGFSPLLIVADETLAEHLWLDFDETSPFSPERAAALRQERLEEAEGVDLDFLRRCDGLEPGPVEGDNIVSYLTSHWDYENNQTYTVILAQIPTAKPWELAAWLPMGGFNDCPPPEVQAAVMRRWHEKYGARPVLVTGEAWEFWAEPLSDTDEALKLAREHYAFCPDRVDRYGRDEYRLGNLADSLMKSAVWYFSWE